MSSALWRAALHRECGPISQTAAPDARFRQLPEPDFLRVWTSASAAYALHHAVDSFRMRRNPGTTRARLMGTSLCRFLQVTTSARTRSYEILAAIDAVI
jgi:hypothetical protein